MIRRWTFGCLVAVYVSSFPNCTDILITFYSSPQAYELLTGNPLVPADISEDDGKLIGWLMSMTGERIELFESQLGNEFFDENGT